MTQAIYRLAWVVDKRPDSAGKRYLNAVLPIGFGHTVGEGSIKLADTPDILAIDFVAIRFVCRAQSTDRSRGKHSLADNCAGHTENGRTLLSRAIPEPDIVVCRANPLEKALVRDRGIQAARGI